MNIEIPLRFRIKLFFKGGTYTYYAVNYTIVYTFKRFSLQPTMAGTDVCRPRGQTTMVTMLDEYADFSEVKA